jgi:iron complex outermembrane receptor protein
VFLIAFTHLNAQNSVKDTVDAKILDNVEIIGTWAGDNTPVTQKTLTKKNLNTESASDLPVLLNSTVSSISSSDAGNGIGYTYLRIRGSDQTRINVTIDGVPVNDAESQNVFWVDLPDIVQDAGAIQIQRGVGTSSFGPGAFGASINVRTAKPSDAFGLDAQIGAGSFNSQKYNLALNSGKLGKFSFRVRGSRVHSDGYIDRAFSNLYSASLQTQYESGKTTFRANVYFGKERTYQAWNGTPYFYYYNGDKTYNPSGLKTDSTFYDDETDNYTQVYSRFIVNHQFTSHSRLQATLYHTYGTGFYNQYKNQQNLSDYFNDVNGYSDLIRERWLRNNLYGINVNYRLSAGRMVHIIGINAQQYLGRHFGIVRQVLSLPDFQPKNYYDNDADKNEQSIYYNSEYTAGKWTLLGDLQLRRLRYNYQGFEQNGDLGPQSADFLFFNPKIGLSYSLTKAINIYTFAGIGNKEPNRDDFTESPYSNKPKNERLINWEAGFRLEKNKLSLQANAYLMRYKNQLVLTGEINDVGAYTRTNVNDSYRRGIEFEIHYNATQWLTFSGNVTLSSNKIKFINEYIDVSADTSGAYEYLPQEKISHTNTDIAYSPDLICFSEIALTPFIRTGSILSGLKIAYNVKYVGSQYLSNFSNPNSKLDAYSYQNLHITWPLSLGKHSLDINFFINNIWDNQIISNGWTYRFKHLSDTPIPQNYDALGEGKGYYSTIGLFPEAGRNFFVTLSYSF